MSVQNSPSATQLLTAAIKEPISGCVCFSAIPFKKLMTVMILTAKKEDDVCTKICKSIALAIVALISAPFILIEVFFNALFSAFVLMGDAIKNSINGTMPQFKQESKALGKSLFFSASTFLGMFVSIASPFTVTAHEVEANAEDRYLKGALDYIETGMNFEE